VRFYANFEPACFGERGHSQGALIPTNSSRGTAKVDEKTDGMESLSFFAGAQNDSAGPVC
jgi:hypothetical protein